MTFQEHESRIDARLDRVPLLGRFNRWTQRHRFGLYMTLLVLCIVLTVLITVEGI